MARGPALITMSHFGANHGRLGNQIFQLGLLFAINQRCGHDFFLARDGEALWDCFELDIPSEGDASAHLFREVNGSCNYDPRVFEQPDGTSYHGWFQSYRYLEGCEAAFARLLRFPVRRRAHSEALLYSYRRRYRRPVVSLHVRRGDYLIPEMVDQWGNLAADGYYERVVQAIGDDVTYLVFSDDLAWCREFFDLEVVEFADFDHCTSLCLMTGCDINVVANSTFSWWGAFLNPGAEVYAPSRWFGPAMTPPNDRQDDIVPSTWRTIAVYGDVPSGLAGRDDLGEGAPGTAGTKMRSA